MASKTALRPYDTKHSLSGTHAHHLVIGGGNIGHHHKVDAPDDRQDIALEADGEVHGHLAVPGESRRTEGEQDSKIMMQPPRT